MTNNTYIGDYEGKLDERSTLLLNTEKDWIIENQDKYSSGEHAIAVIRNIEKRIYISQLEGNITKLRPILKYHTGEWEKMGVGFNHTVAAKRIEVLVGNL